MRTVQFGYKKLQKKSLRNILFWATFIAIFGHMQPSGCGFGMAVGHHILEESTPHPTLCHDFL